jgi:hypothetical protein
MDHIVALLGSCFGVTGLESRPWDHGVGPDFGPGWHLQTIFEEPALGRTIPWFCLKVAQIAWLIIMFHIQRVAPPFSDRSQYQNHIHEMLHPILVFKPTPWKWSQQMLPLHQSNFTKPLGIHTHWTHCVHKCWQRGSH